MMVSHGYVGGVVKGPFLLATENNWLCTQEEYVCNRARGAEKPSGKSPCCGSVFMESPAGK